MITDNNCYDEKSKLCTCREQEILESSIPRYEHLHREEWGFQEKNTCVSRGEGE